MKIKTDTLSPKELYSLFIQCIVPRPIAWVLSDNGNDTYNLAPFSYFNGLSTNPPLVYISVGKKPDGSPKDTHQNIEDRSHFVIHIPSADQATLLSSTAEHLPHQDSEITKYNIPTTQDTDQTLPRLTDASIALYCKKYQITPIGNTPQAIIIGEVTDVYINDTLIDTTQDRLTIDPKKLNPLARLGGPNYATLGNIFSVERND